MPKITLTLKDVPNEVDDFILDKQCVYRKARKTKSIVSKEETIYRLLKEHPDFVKPLS